MIFLAAIVIGAIVLIIISSTENSRLTNLRKNGVQTQGVVIRNKLYVGRIIVCSPIVQFQNQLWELIEAEDTSGMALIIPRFPEGAKVVLIYRKDNPEDFTISSNGRYN